MTIQVYKFSYEYTLDTKGRMFDNYVNRAITYISNNIEDSDFALPKFFRVSVTYLPKDKIPVGKVLTWLESYKKMVDGVSQGRVETLTTGFNYKTYTYNKRDIPLEYPETSISDRVGLDDFHPLEENRVFVKLKDKISGISKVYQRTLLCSVIVTFSNNDSRAGDRYVKKPKKNYLVNLDFGYRRSRRKNNNRRKYRIWN